MPELATPPPYGFSLLGFKGISFSNLAAKTLHYSPSQVFISFVVSVQVLDLVGHCVRSGFVSEESFLNFRCYEQVQENLYVVFAILFLSICCVG